MGECKNCKYFIPDGSPLCGHCGTYQSRRFKPLTIEAYVTIITAIFIGWQSLLITGQSADIKKQTDAIKKQADIVARKFTLENRPYFYIVLSPSALLRPTGTDAKSLLAGVFVFFGNFGNCYATDIEIVDYALYSDKQGPIRYPVKEYWENTYGGIQEYNSVPPGGTIGALDCRADMDIFAENEKRYIQFSIRVKYKGPGKKEEYKYGLDYIYIIDRVINGIPKPLVLSYKQLLAEGSEELPEIKYLIDEYKGKIKK